MHNASTKQRLSALRRKLGIFTGWQPRWVRQRNERRERAERSAAMERARIATLSGEATTVEVAPAGAPERAPAAASQVVASTAPQPLTGGAPVTAAPVPVETAPAGRWCVNRPAAPAPPRRGRSRRIVLGAALAAVVAAGLLALVRGTPAPGPSAAADPARLEGASGRDARVALAAATSPAGATRGAADETTVEVRRGDCLWRIAAVHLGDPMRWPELHAANAGLVHDPDLIFPGQRLRVPAAARL